MKQCKQCKIYVKDEVKATITGLDKFDHEFLYKKFGKYVNGYNWMPKYKARIWDGKIHFFDKAGKIYLRLLPDIIPDIERQGYEITLLDTRLPIPEINTRVTADWFKDNHLKVILRPYQVQAVNTCLNIGSGFIVSPTASGKTLILATLADVFAKNNLRSIVIVPSADLVTQTANTFKLVQIDTGIYSGETKDLSHQVIIATWQALQHNPSIVNEFNTVLVDEGDQAAAKILQELIGNYGKNIAFRFGFTGTMPKDETNLYTLRGVIGDVIFTVTASQLINEGYIAQLEIEPFQIQEAVKEEFPDFDSEKAYLSKSGSRLDLISDLIINACIKYGNTLVLVSSIKQGEELQARIKDSVFLYGASDNDVRAEWYSTFENVDDLIVIATFGIASVGISINRIFALVMIDTGKSFRRSIQSIGRSLRIGHDKDKAHVIDVHSNLRWGMKHFRERSKYYKEAQYPTIKVQKCKV